MSFVKRNYIDGETVITAENLNDIQDELIRIGKYGLSEDVKQALLQIASKVAYIDEHGQEYYDALEAAFYPDASLVSISAVYTQSGTVYDTDSLDSLKADLVVTAHFDDSSTEVVTFYTLSGTLTAGTSTITVSYGGKTTTFNVTVTSLVPTGYTDCHYVESYGGAYISTGLKEYTPSYRITKYSCRIKSHNSDTQYARPVFGYQGTSSGQVSTYRFVLEMETNNTLFYYGAASGKSSALNGWKSDDLNDIEISMTENNTYPVFTINGQNTIGDKKYTSSASSSTGDICLFTQSYQGTPQVSNFSSGSTFIQIYRFKMWKDGVLARDYVPCTRDSDGKAGLYDLVGNTFNPSESQYEFTYG